MAVSALGLPILLQATNTQLDGLFTGLAVGDSVRGRVVEVLGDGKAVVNLRGQNLVAQLPAGSALQKGDALLLQVTQAQAAQTGKPGSLTLRLLADPGAVVSTTGGQASTAALNALPAQAAIEQALGNARLPVSNLTLTVAQTLARFGAPLEPAGLQKAVQSTEALLANEAPVSKQVGLEPMPVAVQGGLREALGQLRVAVSFSSSTQEGVLLGQAVREVAQALNQGPAVANVPVGAQGLSGVSNLVGPALVPALPQAPVAPAPTVQPGPAQAALASNAASAVPVPAALAAVDQAVARLLLQPNETGLQTLTAALTQLRQSVAVADIPGPGLGAPAAEPVRLTEAPPSGPANVPNADFQAGLPSLPARREAMVQLLALSVPANASGAPVATAQVLAEIQTLGQVYARPDSTASRALITAVQAQQPDAAPVQILTDASQSLGAAAQALQAPGTPVKFSGLPALTNLLQDAGLALPKLVLSQLPPEHVAEAVAWLQARDLPAQRPLVEAVASWINQDHTALPATQQAIAETLALPSSFLDARPSLGQALQQLQGALQQSSLQPGGLGLDQQLGQWAHNQGMDFEVRLASLGTDMTTVPATPAVTPGVDPASALKPALARLAAELQAASQDPAAQTAPLARHLESALRQTQAAVQAMNAVPLQAQPAPAFDSVHVPLPVLMNGPLGDGKLSVTWRHGHERRLDDTEPVNVAVALNTDSLGPVKVLLQVWKGSANVRVIGADPKAAQYLAGGADDLRSGFAQRTPFKLQTLEFAAAEGGPQDAPGAPGPDPATAGGFNLSA